MDVVAWAVAAGLWTGLWTGGCLAAPPETVRIGVLSDMSGPFADQAGPGSVVAAQMAAEDFAAENPGFRVEILSADHSNKAEVGSAIVRDWIDTQGVSAVADSVNSAVGLAVNEVIRQKHRTFIASNVGTSDLTGRACAPTTVQWTFDTYALGGGIARALAATGSRAAFFIGFDYALGAALERDATAVFTAAGGRVTGSVKHPLGTADFSSYLLQAQGSGADVIALASTGTDLVNAVKQAHEFGITQRLAGLFTQITDVDAIGLDLARGMVLTEAFYWDVSDATRAFSRRFAARMPGRVPTQDQAGVYSSVLAYLHAVAKAGTVDGEAVVATLKAAPIEDALFGSVTVRPDGRAIHDMYVLSVKSPERSTSRWDVYDVVRVVPGDEAFRPLASGGCPLVSPR